MQKPSRRKKTTLVRRKLSRDAQATVDCLIADRARLRDPALRDAVRGLELTDLVSGDFVYWFAARNAKKRRETLREAAASILGSYGDFCESCGGLIEGFMVNDAVWREAADENEYLCFACVERRLGRAVTYEDFRTYGSAPLNAPWLEPASPLRLFDVDPELLERDQEARDSSMAEDEQITRLDQAMRSLERKLNLRRIRVPLDYPDRDLKKRWTLDTVTLVRVPEPTPAERARGCTGHRRVFSAPTGVTLLRAIDAAAPPPPRGQRFQLQYVRRRGSRLEYELWDPRTHTALIA